MLISLIAAASENNVIGKNNQLPWTLPNDMKYFKNTTWGMPVIMGRKTFESMNNEPLPGRANIVLTSREDFKANGAAVVNTWKDALFVANDGDVKEVFVIGGGAIYKEAIEKADKIYITRVHTTIDDGDAFFPEIDEKRWKLLSKRECQADEKNQYNYTFEVWEKK